MDSWIEEADSIFAKNSISEIKKIEQRIKNEMDGQQDAFRAAVGEKYRQIISIHDSLKELTSLSLNVKDILNECNTRHVSFDSDAFLPLHSPAYSNEEAEHYKLLVMIKVFIEAVEQIWKCVERKLYVNAARILNLALDIYKLDLGKLNLKTKFPLVDKHYQSLLIIKPRILSALNSHAQSVIDISGSNLLIEFYVSYILLSKKEPMHIIQDFVNQRTRSIEKVVSNMDWFNKQGHLSLLLCIHSSIEALSSSDLVNKLLAKLSEGANITKPHNIDNYTLTPIYHDHIYYELLLKEQYVYHVPLQGSPNLDLEDAVLTGLMKTVSGIASNQLSESLKKLERLELLAQLYSDLNSSINEYFTRKNQGVHSNPEKYQNMLLPVIFEHARALIDQKWEKIFSKFQISVESYFETDRNKPRYKRKTTGQDDAFEFPPLLNASIKAFTDSARVLNQDFLECSKRDEFQDLGLRMKQSFYDQQIGCLNTLESFMKDQSEDWIVLSRLVYFLEKQGELMDKGIKGGVDYQSLSDKTRQLYRKSFTKWLDLLISKHMAPFLKCYKDLAADVSSWKRGDSESSLLLPVKTSKEFMGFLFELAREISSAVVSLIESEFVAYVYESVQRQLVSLPIPNEENAAIQRLFDLLFLHKLMISNGAQVSYDEVERLRTIIDPIDLVVLDDALYTNVDSFYRRSCLIFGVLNLNPIITLKSPTSPIVEPEVNDINAASVRFVPLPIIIESPPEKAPEPKPSAAIRPSIEQTPNRIGKIVQSSRKATKEFLAEASTFFSGVF